MPFSGLLPQIAIIHHIYANAAQAVFRVWYSDIDTLTPEVVLEDANEGEKTEKGLKNPE